MEARYPARESKDCRGHKMFTNDGSFKVVFDRVLSGYPTLRVEGGKGANVNIQAHRQATLQLGGGRGELGVSVHDRIAPAFTVEMKNVTEP